MYISPINITQEWERKEPNSFGEKLDDIILSAIHKVGVEVNKEELIKAMQYDRNQYEKGYEDGKKDAVKHGHWISSDGSPVKWDKMNPECPERSCHCSVCGEWLTASDEYPCTGIYCPNCGAKMDEKEKE